MNATWSQRCSYTADSILAKFLLVQCKVSGQLFKGPYLCCWLIVVFLSFLGYTCLHTWHATESKRQGCVCTIALIHMVFPNRILAFARSSQGEIILQQKFVTGLIQAWIMFWIGVLQWLLKNKSNQFNSTFQANSWESVTFQMLQCDLHQSS